ncbi:MAG: Hsp70 family protein, partial [Paracoccaceae bacterium]|nr:Hsp70 family protein [Paracoccaceae bacterium]
RDARQMARLAVTPRHLERLVTVLEMELGHDLAFAVEAAKITANRGAIGEIDLGEIEQGLHPMVREADLMLALASLADRIGAAAQETLAIAGIGPKDVGRVIFVGGSSLIGVVDSLMHKAFPNAAFEHSEVFTAVVNGLALAAGDAD